MAKCVPCEMEVSKRAATCPNCGEPEPTTKYKDLKEGYEKGSAFAEALFGFIGSLFSRGKARADEQAADDEMSKHGQTVRWVSGLMDMALSNLVLDVDDLPASKDEIRDRIEHFLASSLVDPGYKVTLKPGYLALAQYQPGVGAPVPDDATGDEVEKWREIVRKEEHELKRRLVKLDL